MDRAKIRIFAGIGGALFGFAGLVAMAIAIVLALTPLMGAIWATLTIASLFLGIGRHGIYVFMRPQATTAEGLNTSDKPVLTQVQAGGASGSSGNEITATIAIITL